MSVRRAEGTARTVRASLCEHPSAGLSRAGIQTPRDNEEEGLKPREVREREEDPVAKKVGLEVKGLHQPVQGL